MLLLTGVSKEEVQFICSVSRVHPVQHVKQLSKVSTLYLLFKFKEFGAFCLPKAASRVKAEDNEFWKQLEDVRRYLFSKNVDKGVLSRVEDALVQQHQKYHEKSSQQAAKMKSLMDYVRETEVCLVFVACSQIPFDFGQSRPREGVRKDAKSEACCEEM